MEIAGDRRSRLILALSLIGIAVAIACGDRETGPTGLVAPSPVTPMPTDVNALLAQCPTPAEVAVTDSALILSFEGDPTVGRIVCTAAQSSRDLTLLQAQVYRVLTIARRLTFDRPLPWTPLSFYEWLV